MKEKFEIENPFKGKRYSDYDDKFMKDIIFKGKKSNKCNFCKKKVNYETSYYGFNRLLCKKCYKNLEISNQKAVWKMVQNF